MFQRITAVADRLRRSGMTVGLALMVQALWATPADAEEAAPPNVLVIMTDDQGWGDLGLHGNPVLETPVLDRLGRESVRFDRFFVSPVCAPTRASLLTGRDHLRTGVSWVSRRGEVMDADEVTIAELFKAAGYRTGCFGKWHNGAQYPNHPRGQGFDEFFGFCAGHWNDYFDPRLEHGGDPRDTQGYITDVLTDAALSFVKRNRDRPFFCYVPYNAPHKPWQVPDAMYDKYKSKGLDEATASAYGMIENIDANVGRLLNGLEESGLDERTVVIFLTDNGPNGKRYNGGMRGAKGSVHEGGVRVPCFVRWRGELKPRLVRQNAAHIDLLPTLLELCGIHPDPTPAVDGRSLVPLMKGEKRGWPTDRMLFTHRAGADEVTLDNGAVRTDRYRLVREKGRYQLYDMRIDPKQKSNVADEEPEVTARLAAAYEQWFASIDPANFGRPPIPIGHGAAPRVDLPATDAFFDGQVRFYEGHGWAHDWLTNWSRTSDRIEWEVDAANAGIYEVSLLYSCSPDNVGSTIQLETAGRSVTFQLTKPFDTGLRIRPDRTADVRHVREFAKWPIGTVTLPAGKQRITLRATDVAGEEVAQVLGLRLEKQAALP